MLFKFFPVSTESIRFERLFGSATGLRLVLLFSLVCKVDVCLRIVGGAGLAAAFGEIRDGRFASPFCAV